MILLENCELGEDGGEGEGEKKITQAFFIALEK